jgi:galactokinase
MTNKDFCRMMYSGPDPRTEAINEFRRLYGGQGHLFRAPGRVNLIGDHTDYNGGFVLPIAIGYETIAAARVRDDTRVKIYSVNFRQGYEFDLASLPPPEKGRWWNYVLGVAWALQGAGFPLRGMDAVVAGNVPIGAGLSSSAALEVVLALAFLCVSESATLQPQEIASICQKAENDYVGMKCGIMDQFIALAGKKQTALLLDCRSLEYKYFPLPELARIVVVDSGQRRELLHSGYNQRLDECRQAANLWGLPSLRGLNADHLVKGQDMPSNLLARARHVFNENRCTLQAAQALEGGDLGQAGELMKESHISLRDDFSVSTSAVDELWMTLCHSAGVYGARLTGGGFGGCLVALGDQRMLASIKPELFDSYRKKYGFEPVIHLCQSVDGAGEL